MRNTLSYSRLLSLLRPLLLEIPISTGEDTVYPDITDDSRKVVTGGIFVAISGSEQDGRRYIPQAVSRGCKLIIAESRAKEPQQIDLSGEATLLSVSDARMALALIADYLWDHPSRKMALVGITGTNGKTTTATLLHELFTQLGYTTGMIGTIENRIGTSTEVAEHTTPAPLKLNELLHRMLSAGCTHVFMEVSSHAIDQKRTGAIHFSGAVFTNLSRDHLDYHETMQAYLEAKKKLFDLLPKEAFALVNSDDKRGSIMLQNCSAHQVTYALKQLATYKGKVVETAIHGTLLEIEGREVWTQLVGLFNAYNALAVYGTARLLLPHIAPAEVLRALSLVQPAKGRFEVVRGKRCTAIVDYAHTPDALTKTLQAIRPLLTDRAQLICLIGAGGHRDKGKRPDMARAGYVEADRLILTSDNPRDEKPEAILSDMLSGLTPQERQNTLVIADRQQAIRTAVALATPQDIILIAGKGHEEYQEINGVKYPFSDIEEITKLVDPIAS